MLDLHELAGGTLAALFSRTASRDLFDTCKLLRRGDLDRAKLRLAFVVYGGANRRDWRTVSPDDVKVDPVELQNQLLPTLRTTTEELPTNVATWGEQLVSECRDLLEKVLPLTAEEQEFIARLNDRGDIAPELLTSDPVMQTTIREHPALRWQALNVRQHRDGREDA